MQNKKKTKSNRKKGDAFETKVQKQIMSGGLPTMPLDLRNGQNLIECKFSEKKGYRISLDLLEKMWGQALNLNKTPFLSIGIKRNKKQVFVLDCQIRVEKL